MIRIASENDRDAWNTFIGTKHHHAFCWQWREIISRAFKHKPYYIISVDNQINGVLPCFLVNSPLFGKALISMPYLNSGGYIAEDDNVAAKLLEEAKNVANQLKVEYTELRFETKQNFLEQYVCKNHKVNSSLELLHSGEDLFNQFPPKLRSQIRRPSKSGICAEVSTGDRASSKEINGFYDVFSEHMRDLGTPVFPKCLFELTLRNFGKNSRIITAWLEGKCIAAGITIQHGSRVEIPWASSLRKFSKHSPNMLMYWEAIKAASLDGATKFDFGRSSEGSGPHKFKLQWGAKSNTLNWYYLGDKIPNISPDNPKFSLVVNCWKKMPVWGTRVLGPWITRGLP